MGGGGYYSKLKSLLNVVNLRILFFMISSWKFDLCDTTAMIHLTIEKKTRRTCLCIWKMKGVLPIKNIIFSLQMAPRRIKNLFWNIT